MPFGPLDPTSHRASGRKKRPSRASREHLATDIFTSQQRLNHVAAVRTVEVIFYLSSLGDRDALADDRLPQPRLLQAQLAQVGLGLLAGVDGLISRRLRRR